MSSFGFPALRRDWRSSFLTWLTALAAAVILVFLAMILAGVLWQGKELFSWRFLTSRPGENLFDADQAGVLPMLAGTVARVMLMAAFTMPAGVLTAIYLVEYAPSSSPATALIRSAVQSLAGVPSIVIGLFGLAFFVHFVGGHLDQIFRPESSSPYWNHPGLLWASLTMAILTLPAVSTAVEESLRARSAGLREASMALGATRLQTVVKVILPRALPGILTGGLLAVSRAAGAITPILFTGAAHSTTEGSSPGGFMDLGYYVFILWTQSPNDDGARAILYAVVMALLLLTFPLNAAAIFIRERTNARSGMFR